MGKKSTATKNRWNAKSYDRINLCVKKGIRDQVKAAAENKGVSVAEYIKAAIKAKYEAETGEEIAL